MPQTGPLPNLCPVMQHRAKGLQESGAKVSFMKLRKVWQQEFESAETPVKSLVTQIKF